MAGPPTPGTVSTKQARIAQLAKQMPATALRSLSHHMDHGWLCEAFRRTRSDGAVGIDGQTAAEYAEELKSNLQNLLDRAKSRTYRAPPVRRVHIPKGDGSKRRPIGIPTFDDKVLQRAVVMLLEPVYEQDFYDCSYGFRPGQSAHDALQALNKGLWEVGGGWILDVDTIAKNRQFTIVPAAAWPHKFSWLASTNDRGVRGRSAAACRDRLHLASTTCTRASPTR